MKTRGFIVTILAAALALGLSKTLIAASGAYAAKLISPTAGQVLVPGQQVKVEWKTILPNVDLSWCELELYLSIDGGRTFPFRITPQLDPRASFFYWTVPNTPTAAAVLDIRFGCEGSYPESYSPQTASPFVIVKSAGELY
jgi:hypothetical protein